MANINDGVNKQLPNLKMNWRVRQIIQVQGRSTEFSDYFLYVLRGNTDKIPPSLPCSNIIPVREISSQLVEISSQLVKILIVQPRKKRCKQISSQLVEISSQLVKISSQLVKISSQLDKISILQPRKKSANKFQVNWSKFQVNWSKFQQCSRGKKSANRAGKGLIAENGVDWCPQKHTKNHTKSARYCFLIGV